MLRDALPRRAPSRDRRPRLVAQPGVSVPPPGDGSPMEEGCVLQFVPLAEALRMCDRGDIEDAKTELVLRRLHAYLARAETTARP